MEDIQQFENYRLILESGDSTWHRVFVLSAAFIGGALIRYDAKSWALDFYQKAMIFCIVAIGSMMGAILPAYYAGAYVGDFFSDVSSFGAVQGTPFLIESLLGPKTILGGFLLGFFLVAVYKRIAAIHFDTSDAFARGTCLMMAIGRLGCIVQHCCFGRVVHPQLGFDFGDGQSRFPVQALESFLLVVLFGVLSYFHQKNLYRGRRLFIFFSCYGVARFFLEFLRESIAKVYLGLGYYQWLALVLLGVGLWQIFKRERMSKLEDLQTA